MPNNAVITPPHSTTSQEVVSLNAGPAELRSYAFTYQFRGWLVLAAALSNYVLILNRFAAPWLPWLVLMPVLALGQALHARRQPVYESAAARHMNWLQRSFLLTLLPAFVMATKLGWETVHPPLLASYGLTALAAGCLLRFRPLQLGGLLGGLLGIAAAWVPAPQQLLLIAVVMVGSFVLPGYALTRHSHRLGA